MKSLQPVILVVEDEDAVRREAVESFREAGFEVLEAASGMAAIMILQQRLDICAVFTDVVMPSAPDGFRLAEFIHATSPGCVILVTSGAACPLSLPNTRTKFIPKPYTGPQVVGLIREMMQSVLTDRPKPTKRWRPNVATWAATGGRNSG